MVARGADIAVVTGRIVERVYASVHRVASVRRTHVPVITVQQRIVGALAPFAMVSGSTFVPVGAWELRRLVQTTGDGAARIIGTWIAVVTKQRRTRDTEPFLAKIVGGARIAVAARAIYRRIQALTVQLATILSASIAVVAVNQAGGCTDTFRALIPRGACVTIIALPFHILVVAAGGRIAHVRGARIAVEAVGLRPARACTVGAHIVDGASVAIIASD